jgi:hypothetical protein
MAAEHRRGYALKPQQAGSCWVRGGSGASTATSGGRREEGWAHGVLIAEHSRPPPRPSTGHSGMVCHASEKQTCGRSRTTASDQLIATHVARQAPSMGVRLRSDCTTNQPHPPPPPHAHTGHTHVLPVPVTRSNREHATHPHPALCKATPRAPSPNHSPARLSHLRLAFEAVGAPSTNAVAASPAGLQGMQPVKLGDRTRPPPPPPATNRSSLPAPAPAPTPAAYPRTP